MDSIDREILKLLEHNGRIAVKEISQQINLSSPAVSERIKRLEENGIIKGYQALLSYEKLGYNIRAIINITMDVTNYQSFYQFASEESGIIECYHVTGSYRMSVKVAVSNVAELEILVNKIQAFGSTNTQIILSSPFPRKGYTKNL